MMEEDKITLSRGHFKALSSDTRVSILKLLLKRRMTLTELSKSLGMSAPTVKEHMDSLSSANLVRQVDDGHKWKYYELTRDGRGIVQPSERRIMVILGISVMAALFGLNGLASRLYSGGQQAFSATRELVMAPSPAEDAGNMLGAAVPEATIQAVSLPAFPYLEFGLAIAALVVLGVCIGYLYSRRRRP